MTAHCPIRYLLTHEFVSRAAEDNEGRVEATPVGDDKRMHLAFLDQSGL
jgi:hypothetical protein